MNVESFFYQLSSLEEESAQFYEQMRQLTLTMPRVEALFKRLSQEEKAHKNHINLAKAYQSQGAEHFFIRDGCAETIQTARQILAYLGEKFTRNPPLPPFLDLLTEVLEFEKEMEASHYSSYIEIKDEALRNLLLQLSQFDKNHVNEIHTFRQEILSTIQEDPET
jgi:rubrerythrin